RRTSSTPATSSQVVFDFARESRCFGCVRGTMADVRHSSHTIMMMTPKNASGSHVVAKFASQWNQSPIIRSPQRGGHLLRVRELNAALPPDGRDGGDAVVVEAAGSVLDEADAAARLQQAADRHVGADVG